MNLKYPWSRWAILWSSTIEHIWEVLKDISGAHCVAGVGFLCCNLYSFVVYLNVNGSGSITSVGEERANLSAVVYL